MNDADPLFLADLADTGAATERLTTAGMRVPPAADKADLLADAAQALLEAGADDHTPLHALYVPGRIEVLGKHTDYAGGSSIIAAAERGLCLVAAPREDPAVRVFDAVYDEQAEFDLSTDLPPTPGHWSNYLITVARRLAANFPGNLCGADVALAADLPPAAGMSSSSAMMVAMFLALARVNELWSAPRFRANIDSDASLAEYLGAVENGQSYGSLAADAGVGTFGGSEDHTAMLCCRAGALSQYAYRPVRIQQELPMPAGCLFAVASSGVIAEKTGRAMPAYNRASLLAAGVAEAWRRATGRNDPHIAAALASPAGGARAVRNAIGAVQLDDFTSAELTGRFEHFCAENEQIIPAAADALADANLDEFGRQVDRSQELAETLLGNQVPETVFLARCARELGAPAASAFGAGFGGSVWALVAANEADAFLDEWAGRYQQAHPAAAEGACFFLTAAGPAAFELT